MNNNMYIAPELEVSIIFWKTKNVVYTKVLW